MMNQDMLGLYLSLNISFLFLIVAMLTLYAIVSDEYINIIKINFAQLMCFF